MTKPIDLLILDDDDALLDLTYELISDDVKGTIIKQNHLNNMSQYYSTVKVVLIDSFYGKAFSHALEFKKHGAIIMSYSGGDLSPEELSIYDYIIAKPGNFAEIPTIVNKHI
jgi:hypothetical protein